MKVVDDFKAYLKATFDPENLLTNAEIEQVLSSAAIDVSSGGSAGAGVASDANATIDIKTDPRFERCRRVASRIYNTQLLMSNAPDAYEHFTRAYWNNVDTNNIDTTYSPVLEKNEFDDLKTRFHSFDPLMKATLRVSTILNSEAFDDIEKAKKIPIVQALFDAYPAESARQRITGYLQSAFSPRHHYLDMLSTAGNATMFRELAQAVRERSIGPEQYNFWVCHSTIKIAGLMGHIEAQGSLYLNHNTYKAMKAMENTLQLLFTDNPPTCEALLDMYLDERGRFLAAPETPQHPFAKPVINSLPPLSDNERRLLAHIASMMQLFHPDEGDVLEFGLRLIPKIVLKDLTAIYFDTSNPNELTPTYAAAFFQNAFDYRRAQYSQETILKQIEQSHLSKKVKLSAERLKRLLGITDIIVGYLPLYLQILKEYKRLAKEGKIPANQPLTFREAASTIDISKVFGTSPVLEPFDVLTHFRPTIDGTGKIKIERIAPPVHFFSQKADGVHHLPEDTKWRFGPGNVLVTKSTDKDKDKAILDNAVANINAIIAKNVPDSEPNREVILTSQYGKGIAVVDDELLNNTDLSRDSTGRIVIAGDGLFCMQDNILLLNKSGDAHAIVFESHKAIGITVGSWRCVKKGILSNMMDFFLKNEIDPKDITIRLGPGIGSQSYDLGEKEYSDLLQENPKFSGAFVKKVKQPKSPNTAASNEGNVTVVNTNNNNASASSSSSATKPQKYVMNFVRLIEIFAQEYGVPGATMKVIADESSDTYDRPIYKSVRDEARAKKNPEILRQYYAHRQHFGARLYNKVHGKTIEISKANGQPIPNWLPEEMAENYGDTGRNLNGVYRPKLKN